MDYLRAAARSIGDDLAQLGAVASARRRGEQLITLALGPHSASLERLVALSPDADLLEADAEIAEVLWVHRPMPDEDRLLDGFSDRLDQVLTAIEQTGVPGQAETASRLLDTVGSIYGGAHARAFELLHEAGHHEAIRAALDDDLISSALVAYGLHPDDVESRVRRALADVTATFPDSGPDVVFVGIDDGGTIRLRAEGEPVRDRWRVALAAERAVAAATPDAAGVEVEGAEGDEPAHVDDVFIPLTSIGRRGARRRWVEVPELAAVGSGQLMQVTHEDLRLLACRVGPDLYVALDPFNGDTLRLRLSPNQPPEVHSSAGRSFVFDNPLPVQRDGDLIEVAVP